MTDIFISPLQNSKEYKDIINSIEGNKGTVLVNGLLACRSCNLMITSLYLSFSRTEPKMDSTGLEYILMGIGWSQECCQRDIKGRWGIVGTDGRGDFQGPPVKVICCYIKNYPKVLVT